MIIQKDKNGNVTQIQFENDDIYLNVLNIKALIRDDDNIPKDAKFNNTIIILPETDQKYIIADLGIINVPEKVGAIEKDERFSNCTIIGYSNNLIFDDCDFTEFTMIPPKTQWDKKTFYIQDARGCTFPDSSVVYKKIDLENQ